MKHHLGGSDASYKCGTWPLTAGNAARLVYLLHGRLLVETILLERRKVIHRVVGIEVVVVVDRQAELDEAVDARCERRRLVEREARREQRRVIEQPDEVLDRLVRLVGLGLVAERLDDRVDGVPC